MNELFGYLYSFCFLVCYIPQIYKIIKTKNVEGISLWMFFLTILGYIFQIMYQWLGIGWKPSLIMNSVLGIMFACFIMFLCKKYRKNVTKM